MKVKLAVGIEQSVDVNQDVEAKDFKEGDELTTDDGDTATVDSVECVHHDEPVTVYNFCVMEDEDFLHGKRNSLQKSCFTGQRFQLYENVGQLRI